MDLQVDSNVLEEHTSSIFSSKDDNVKMFEDNKFIS